MLSVDELSHNTKELFWLFDEWEMARVLKHFKLGIRYRLHSLLGHSYRWHVAGPHDN